MKRHLVFVGVVCLLVIPASAPAPIFGFFPGLDELVRRSDAIVVGRIVKTSVQRRIEIHGAYEPWMGASDGHEDHVVEVLKTIRGNLKEGETCVIGIRDLLVSAELGGISNDRISSGSVRLLFLGNTPPFSPYTPEGEPAIAWTLNCEGASYPLNSEIDSAKLKDGDPREQIAEILHRSLELSRKTERFEKEERRHDAFLGIDDASAVPTVDPPTPPVRTQNPTGDDPPDSSRDFSNRKQTDLN
ncbi:hypothetical protein JW916_06220 [Candidatus Sumerlaeota bacterium]|nr:hypothetical protein [Candidatus Sumerlaeota bacterium]